MIDDLTTASCEFSSQIIKDQGIDRFVQKFNILYFTATLHGHRVHVHLCIFSIHTIYICIMFFFTIVIHFIKSYITWMMQRFSFKNVNLMFFFNCIVENDRFFPSLVSALIDFLDIVALKFLPIPWVLSDRCQNHWCPSWHQMESYFHHDDGCWRQCWLFELMICRYVCCWRRQSLHWWRRWVKRSIEWQVHLSSESAKSAFDIYIHT